MTEKLDIYSDMRLPFDVATWCRGHKLNIVAVNISRDLKALDELRAHRDRLEQQEAEMEARLRGFVEEARIRMAGKV